MDPVPLILRNVEEVVTEEDLRRLVSEVPNPRGYIGFEPSGTAHVGYLLIARKIRDLQDAGVRMSILLADWHAAINDKYGGDLEAIDACAEYMKDMFLALGVREDVTFVKASDYVDDARYWETVIRVGKASSLSRVKRAMSIMGRREEEAELDYIKTLYPVMQAADIFHNEWKIAYGGLDQRHAHMLARDAAEKLKWWKPVAIHTPLVPGLSEQGGRMDPLEAKMSKSKADSGLFLHDEPALVEEKLRNAFCPAKETRGNPVLALFRLVLFPRFEEVVVDRPAKFGGAATFRSADELEKAFEQGLHPLDLKRTAATYVNRALSDVHAYFKAKPRSLERMIELRAKHSR